MNNIIHSSGITERLAVHKLNDIFVRTSLIVPHIDSGDKYPSWDGTIILYESERQRAVDIVGRVPVQVKGKNVTAFSSKSLSYPVDIVDLQNYLSDNGCIYFVVQVDAQGNGRVFFKSLLSPEIRALLDKKKRKTGTVSIRFERFPETEKGMVYHVKWFIANRKLQTPKSRYLGPEAMVPNHTLTIPILDETPIEYLMKQKHFMYQTNGEGSSHSVIGLFEIESMSQDVPHPVYVCGEEFYSSITFKKTLNGEILYLGESIQMDAQSCTMSYSLKGTLAEQIRDIRFLKAIDAAGMFRVEDIRINMDQKLTKKSREGLTWFEKFYVGIQSILNLFGVSKEINVRAIDDSSLKNANLLIDVVLYNRKIHIENLTSGIQVLRIGNLNLLVVITQKENGFVAVHDFFGEFIKDCYMDVKLPDQSEIRNTSACLMLKSETLTKCDNTNYEVIEASIERHWLDNEHFYSLLGLLVLEIIKAHDMLGAAGARALESADRLNGWIRKKHPDNIYEMINHYQIAFRKEALSAEDQQVLIGLKRKHPCEAKVRCAINILLGGIAEARMDFAEMTESEREEFRDYPIYTLAGGGLEQSVARLLVLPMTTG